MHTAHLFLSCFTRIAVKNSLYAALYVGALLPITIFNSQLRHATADARACEQQNGKVPAVYRSYRPPLTHSFGRLSRHVLALTLPTCLPWHSFLSVHATT